MKKPIMKNPNRTDSTKKQPTVEEPKNKEPDKDLRLDRLRKYRKRLLKKKQELIEKRDRAKASRHLYTSSDAEFAYALAAARCTEIKDRIEEADIEIAECEESQPTQVD